MPKETVNRRVQFTKTALRDAMIELICEKPLTSITVKDVCARADINRSTFYLHYKDVDSLLVAVEDYAIEYIQSHFKGLGNAFDELVDFLTYMKNTPRLRTFERRWLEHLPSSGLDDEKTLVYSYVQPGIVSVFYSWLTDKMPNMSAEQLVCLLQKLILHGMTGLGEDLFPFGSSRA